MPAPWHGFSVHRALCRPPALNWSLCAAWRRMLHRVMVRLAKIWLPPPITGSPHTDRIFLGRFKIRAYDARRLVAFGLETEDRRGDLARRAAPCRSNDCCWHPARRGHVRRHDTGADSYRLRSQRGAALFGDWNPELSIGCRRPHAELSRLERRVYRRCHRCHCLFGRSEPWSR
jgi:hypothetical protein